MRHIYDLTILNCIKAVTNIFENNIEPLKTNSYELKKHIRTITNGNFYPNKNIDITAYTYLELLSGYFYKSNSNINFDTINYKDDSFKNLETLLKNEGFDVKEVTPEKALKIYTTIPFYLAANFKESVEKNEKLSDENKAIYSSLYHRIVNIAPIPYQKGNKLYFTFLFLLIIDFGIEYTSEILEFHYQKSIISKLFFIDDLKIQIKLIPKIFKDDLIIAEIKEWISKKPNRNYEKIDFSDLVIDFNPEITNEQIIEKDITIPKKVEAQTGLQSLFIVEDWELYVDVLTKCKNPLLQKENYKYKFIGNNKGDRGIVGSWFNYLKQDGKIARSYKREDIADILTKEILNYSISASNVEDESRAFLKIKQSLINILNTSLSMNKHA